jgi:hypothetical protein
MSTIGAMETRSLWALLALMSFGLVGTATAGILDGQAPVLGDGVSSTIVYRMGAVHFEPGGWVDTTVTCTNLASAPAVVALEIFDESDQKVGALAKATVAASAAITFATSADAAPGAIAVDNLPPIDHGKARVSASTTQLTCSAMNRMRAADGTVKEAPLELMKKVAL